MLKPDKSESTFRLYHMWFVVLAKLLCLHAVHFLHLSDGTESLLLKRNEMHAHLCKELKRVTADYDIKAVFLAFDTWR